MKYLCSNCLKIFDEPKIRETTKEYYFGVGSDFVGKTPFYQQLCPYCDSDEFIDMKKCDVCEEYFDPDDLTDTEGMVNGGVGYACPSCLGDMEE
jgi:methionyl-tRNA synthetase